MSEYYVDFDGKLKKKKKGQNQNLTTTGDYYVDYNGNISQREKELDEELAPVKTTTKTTDNSRLDFFSKGAFEDGWQKGDLWDTILGTAADAGINLVKGVGSMVEGVVDLGAYGVAGVADALGADRFANRLKKVTKESQMDYVFSFADDYVDQNSVLGRTSDAILQGVGQVGGIIATGSLGAAGGLGAVGTTALTTGVTGASGMGAGMGEAYKAGATDEEAVTYGAIAGASDALTELMFGGLGKAVGAVGLSKGISSADDVLAKKVSGLFKSQMAKNFAEYGIKAGAEGFEEVVAGTTHAIGKKITYMSEEELGEIIRDENLLEQFIVGAVTSGIAQSGYVPGMKDGSLKQANETGRDFITGFTQDEQAVIDKEVEKRIAEQEQDGKVLSNKEIGAIEKQVTEEIDKGYISIDTIEETLGGDTYKAYRETVDKEDALQNEFDTLNKMKQGEMTGEQIDRRTELKQQLADLKTNSQRDQLKKKLSEEVYGVAQGSRLAESYNEKARRSQKFEADLTKYDAKQQEVIKKAVDSGILNNTNRTHEFVDLIAKISADKGVLFDFTNNAKLKESGFAIDGKFVNGYVTKDGVTLNIQSAKALNSVVGHEITHILEGTELYTELQNAVKQYAESKGDYKARLDAITKLYEGVKDADVNAEITADLVGDYLFTDADFVRKLSVEHRNVFQKIYDEIKYLAKVATAGSKEARQLEKAKKVFADVYRAETKNTVTEDGVKRLYSLGEYTQAQKDNWKQSKKIVLYESDAQALEFVRKAATDGSYAGKLYFGTVTPELAEVIKEKTGLDVEGRNVTLRAGNVRKIIHEHGNEAKEKAKKQRAVTEDDFVKIREVLGEFDDVELSPDEYEGKPAIIFKKRIDDSLHTVIAVDSGGSLDLFVQTMYVGKKKGSIANVTNADALIITPETSVGTAPNESVAQKEENVNRKYSLSADSKGRELSPAVKSRYANSKVVDEDGNLKAVYHGTASGEFSIFDKSKGSVEGDFGSGFYFTDNEVDVSNNYEDGGPDFDNKVARLAEQIEQEEDIDYDEAEQRAREELYKGGHKFEVYLNIENPAIVGETMLFDQDSYYSEYNEEDYDDYDDYVGDVEQLIADDVENIVWEVEKNVDVYSTDGLADILFDAVYSGGIGIEELKAKINELYFEDSNGNLVGNEVTRQIIESLGYDGIIDPTVSTKWNMDMEEDTTHYIVFKPNQIKSVTNENPTDNPDIHRSLSNEDEIASTFGNYNVRGKDIALKTAPVQEDVAPVRESVQATVQDADALPDDYAPVTEAEANAQADENLATITDEDAPPVEEAEHDDFTDTTAIDPKALKDISKALKDVLFLNNKEVKAIGEVVQKYSTSEFPDKADLFDELQAKFGKKETVERNEETAAIKRMLRGYPINVSQEIKNDIADYGQFFKRNFGKIRFSKEGVPVDTAYQDLADMFPGYFPADITNATDQLIRISEVAGLDINETETFELSDGEIMEAVDAITAEVAKYKEAQVLAGAEADRRAAFAEIEDIAPVREDIEPSPAESVPAAETNPRIKELQAIVEHKDGYISQQAMKLYREIVNLKKGVRASKDLGYLLDHGYEWKTIKRALLDITDNPGHRVDQNSPIESVAREMLNSKYEDAVYELDDLLANAQTETGQPIKTVKERLAVKLQNAQAELAQNKTLRAQANEDYNQEIARLYAEYNAKKNKTTKAANDILRRVERLKRIKGNVDADYAKRISDIEARVAKASEEARTGESTTEQAAMRREVHTQIVDNIKTTFGESGYDFDKVLENAKDLSTFATVDNTPQRVMEKSLGYKEGRILADLTVNKVAQNETAGIKWLNSFTDRKTGLLAKISKQYNIKPGSKESAAAQMYAEGFYVNDKEEIVQYGDAELAKDFPDAAVRANIKGLAKDERIRQIYDETLAAINKSRARNAYPEIQRLDNYFLHFRAMDDTFSRLGIPFNPNDIKAKDLPTDLNGVTADLKPGQPYFASAMHRKGQRTSFDLLGGLEQYLTGAKDQIYHIDDIQTLRALRNYIADNYGQAKGLDNLDALTEEEAEAKIKEVYNGHLSTFAKFLNEEANVIAGKTSLTDRGLEGVIGRRGIAFLDTVNRQVGSNMIGFNVSSSLTNFLSAVQGFAKVNKTAFVKALAQTTSNKLGAIVGKSDGFAEQSPVIIRRKGADRYHRTMWQKAGDAGYALMGAVDNISTELLARAKYNELTAKGMDAQQAHIETDKWVSRLMGDRSLGQQPQLYNSKMLGMVTKFQLEVRNQLDSQFYDTIQDAKVSTEDIENGLKRNAVKAAKIGSTFFQLAVLQHLFGKAFESIAGYNPAFDIISVLAKTFGWDDEEDDEDTALDNLQEGFLELMGDLPYTSTFTGGRIPISSALPIEQLVTGKDQYGNEKSRLETIKETAPYYVLPGGYGQIKKTTQGLGMFDDDLPIAGSYTNSGNLRYPVEDTVGNRVQAALFGQYANKNARDYFDNERAPLKEKQIQELIDTDLPIREYWDYRDGLKDRDTVEEKVNYIAGLDLPIDTKNILVNNAVDRKDPIDLTGYDTYSDYEEFDFAVKKPEMYQFLKDNGVTVFEYLAFDKDTKEAYTWAYNNPERYTMSKAIASDVAVYRQYARELNDITADRENGVPISGSRKDKVISYINGLDADFGQKMILFKSEYEADDTYNAEIVEYLNSRSDISFEESVAILRELGFTVLADGTVRW